MVASRARVRRRPASGPPTPSSRRRDPRPLATGCLAVTSNCEWTEFEAGVCFFLWVQWRIVNIVGGKSSLAARSQDTPWFSSPPESRFWWGDQRGLRPIEPVAPSRRHGRGSLARGPGESISDGHRRESDTELPSLGVEPELFSPALIATQSTLITERGEPPRLLFTSGEENWPIFIGLEARKSLN